MVRTRTFEIIYQSLCRSPSTVLAVESSTSRREGPGIQPKLFVDRFFLEWLAGSPEIFACKHRTPKKRGIPHNISGKRLMSDSADGQDRQVDWGYRSWKEEMAIRRAKKKRTKTHVHKKLLGSKPAS